MSRSPLDVILEFGRTVRSHGLPVTTDQITALVQALRMVGLDDREKVFCASRALLVTRREHLETFRQLFDSFWSVPGEGPPQDSPTVPPAPRQQRPPDRFTVATYMAFKARSDDPELDVADRSGTYAVDEVLHRKRFAEMTAEELEAVRRLIRELRWQAALRVTRRRRPDPAGRRVDLRRTLARAARMGSIPPRLPRRSRKVKPRPVALLADVSGSMEKYSRLILQFFHSVVASLPKVETFVFSTRLTRITEQLQTKEIDQALDEVSQEVDDWAGGTRIAACLRTFNRTWSRRVLRRGALVVVISDGCDAEGGEGLALEARRLKHRCHRLIWLNPYLGNRRYEPRVAGMRSVLPFLDHFLPADDLQALKEFSGVLARIPAWGTAPRHRPVRSGAKV